MNVIVLNLEYAGEVWEGNAKFVKQLETVHMTGNSTYDINQLKKY